MSDSVGRVDLDLGMNYKAFNQELNSVAGKATTAVGGAFKKLGLIIAGAFAVKEMVGFGRAAINLASDLDEVQNVVDVTFGAMSGHVDNFAKNALATFGLSELSAKRYASTMGAMLKSSGLTGNAVVKLSEDMTGLAADFASFYNLNNDMAFDKIRAGISGETEPLKQLGINMSVANLEAFALTQGIKKQFAQMSQAEQVLLRYNYLMSVSADAQGDFARTSDGWANQTRLLSEQWKIFQGTMGQGFINVLTPVIGYMNQLIAKLQVAAKYFKAFTEMLFGAQKAAGTGTAAVAGLGSAASGSAEGMDDMSGAAGKAGKAAKKAGKDVKGSLSTFDEINVIAQQTAEALDSTAAGMGGVGGDLDLGGLDLGEPLTPEVDLSKVQPLLDFFSDVKRIGGEVGNWFKTEFGPPIKSAIDTLSQPLSAWKNTFATTFAQLAPLAAPFKNWLINDFVPLVKAQMQLAANVLAGLLDTANKVFTGLRDAALPILTWFVVSGLPLLTDFSQGAIKVFQAVFDSVKTIFDTLWEKGVNPGLTLLSQMVVDSLNIIKETWDKFGDDIVNGLVLVFDNITVLFQTLWDVFLGPIWNTMLETMKWLWDNHFEALFQQVATFIGKLVTGVLGITNKFIVPVVNLLIKSLGPAFSNVFQTAVLVLGTLLATVADVAKGLFKSLGGIIDFIVGIFTADWKRAWTGVKDIYGGIMDMVVGVFKGTINLLIDAANMMIRNLNNALKIEVPDWIPLIGGKKLSVNIPTIPKLAQGGMVSAPTLAMVGDNRNAAADPEVVTPLSKLSGMLEASNQAVVEVLFMILDVLERLDLSVDIDGERLTRIVKQYLDVENNRIGKRLVTVGGMPV